MRRCYWVMIKQKLLILVSLCAFGLSACGGGGGGTDSSVSKAPLTGPKQGYVMIEERANKRVVDAWFSQGLVSDQNFTALWNDESNRCVELQDASASGDEQVFQVGTRWRDTLYAGAFIKLESRTGELTRLLPQRYGDAVLYASAERWVAEPLPEDTHITISGSEQFPAFDSIAISPLTRLVRTAPTNGVTHDASAPVTWEVSDASDDSIELTVSVSDNTQFTAKSIRCWLSDSGHFELPDAVQQVLPENTQWVVGLVRTRNASYDSEGAQLHISQSSYP